MILTALGAKGFPGATARFLRWSSMSVIKGHEVNVGSCSARPAPVQARWYKGGEIVEGGRPAHDPCVGLTPFLIPNWANTGEDLSSMRYYLWEMRPYFRQVAGQLVLGSMTGFIMNTAIVLPPILLGWAIDVALAFERGDVGPGAVGWAALADVGRYPRAAALWPHGHGSRARGHPV